MASHDHSRRFHTGHVGGQRCLRLHPRPVGHVPPIRLQAHHPGRHEVRRELEPERDPKTFEVLCTRNANVFQPGPESRDRLVTCEHQRAHINHDNRQLEQLTGVSSTRSRSRFSVGSQTDDEMWNCHDVSYAQLLLLARVLHCDRALPQAEEERRDVTNDNPQLCLHRIPRQQ